MNEDYTTFKPVQHFLTLFKLHQTYSVKILIGRVLNRLIKENVATLAGILDKLEQ